MKVIPNLTNSLSLCRNYLRNRLKNSIINNKYKKTIDFYEEFIGLKEVRKTQENVLKIESDFIDSSKARRTAQNEMIGLQEQLKQIRQKLDSTHRGDESYLPLITKEHQLIKTELQMINSLRSLEETERELFSKFSQKLRDAHEFERLRQEKNKFLSVIGSIIGACLGIIATSVNHALKRKDFKAIAHLIETQNNPNIGMPSLVIPTSNTTNLTKVTTETQTDNISEDKIVEKISLTESNLEYKMKINAITTVAAIYALIAITLPIILRIFTD